MTKFFHQFCLLAGITLFIALCVPKHVSAQGQFTNMGKDFLMGFSNNYDVPYVGGYEDGLHLEFKIVTSRVTHVRITYNFDNSVEEFDIPANEARSYVLTDAQRNKVYATTSDVSDLRTMRIETDNNVTIYAISLVRYTTDATAVLPINNWGKEYVLVGTPDDCGYNIIAKEDGTIINVPGQGTITLSKNQIFRKVLSNTSTRGAKITSNKDIAFFTTTKCTSWPSGACDHQLEQLVPTANFGKEFLVPKAGMSVERMCIVATDNNTTLTIRSGTSTPTTQIINTGTITVINITQDTYISADKQIGITAHIGGISSVAGCGGDPATAWVPPIEQNINRAYIAPFVTSKSAIICHYILLAVKTVDKSLTTINGVATSSGWRDHPSGYSVLTYQMPTLIPYEVINPKGVIVLAYGVGPTESYYYLAASSARKLDASFTINGTHYQDANLSTPFDCGTPFDFAATVQYEMSTNSGHLKWFIDGVEEVAARDQLTWTKPYLSGTNHEVKLQIIDASEVMEELSTTLVVECSTGMTPATAVLYEGDQVEMTIALGSGITPTNLTFTLSAAAGTTAIPSDYVFPASITMTAGTDEVRFNVSATTDQRINEPDVLLKLKATASGYPDMNADITIKDRSTAAQRELSLSVSPAIIHEPGGAPISTQVKVSLPPGVTSATTLRVPLSYAGSVAALGADYSLTPSTSSGYFDLPADNNNASFTVTALADNIVEGSEDVKILGTAPAGHTMRAGADRVTITINDLTPGDIMVERTLPSNGNASEPGTNGQFRIKFKDPNVTSTSATQVTYTMSGTAVNGTDYATVMGTVVIPQGQKGVDIPIVVINNFRVEGTRTVDITITAVTSI